MSLTEEERREIVTSYLADLEEEHSRREMAAARVKRKVNRSRELEEKLREEEAQRIRNELRLRFYEKHGYEQATDRTGRLVWLSPAELGARKRKRRRKSKRYKLDPRRAIRLRDVGLFVLMCASAVVIGLMLAN